MSDREKEDRYGRMAPCMKDGGATTKPTARADSSMLTVMYMMDSGKMTRLMVSESTAILMAPNTRAIEIGRAHV